MRKNKKDMEESKDWRQGGEDNKKEIINSEKKSRGGSTRDKMMRRLEYMAGKEEENESGRNRRMGVGEVVR